MCLKSYFCLISFSLSVTIAYDDAKNIFYHEYESKGQ